MEKVTGKERVSVNRALEDGRHFAGTLMMLDSSSEVLEASVKDFIETYQLLIEEGALSSAGILLDNYFFPPLRVLYAEGCFDRDLNLFLNIFTDDVISELKGSGIMEFLNIIDPGIAADIKCVEKNEVMRYLRAFDFDADSCSLLSLVVIEGFDRLTERTRQRVENILIEMLRRMFSERTLSYGEGTVVEDFIAEAQARHFDSLNDRIGYYCRQLGCFEDITECNYRRFDLARLPFGVIFESTKNRRTEARTFSVRTQFTIGMPPLPQQVRGPSYLTEHTLSYRGGVKGIAKSIWRRIRDV